MRECESVCVWIVLCVDRRRRRRTLSLNSYTNSN